MKRFRSILAWAAALALLLCLFTSCAEKPAQPGSSGIPETTRAAADPAEAAAYAVYAAAAEKTAGLTSEKRQSELSLGFSLHFGDKTVKTVQKQRATQVFAAGSGELPDYSCEAVTEKTAEETGETSTAETTLWVRDGTAYLRSGASKTRTEDLDSLGLEFLRTGIHSGFLYRIPAEAVSSAGTENGRTAVTAAGTGETLRAAAVELLQELHVLDTFFGSVLDADREASLLESMELLGTSFTAAAGADGYLSDTEAHLSCRFPVSGDLQSKVLGEALADQVTLLVTVDRVETFREPGAACSVGLPEDPEAYRTVAAAEGAASLEELTELLKEDYLFTERQVACMTQEFLFSCIYTCDPANAPKLYEAQDFAAIAALLNEKFFASVGNKALKYAVADHTDYTVTDEMRRQNADTFRKSYDQAAGQYGAYFAQRVLEEIQGRQAMIFPVYITADRDGKPGSGPENPSAGLYFSVVNGRYYWNDFSLLRVSAEGG